MGVGSKFTTNFKVGCYRKAGLVGGCGCGRMWLPNAAAVPIVGQISWSVLTGYYVNVWVNMSALNCFMQMRFMNSPTVTFSSQLSLKVGKICM